MKKTLTSILMPVFNISLTLFLILGAIIVIVQLFSIITFNGPLSISVYKAFKLWAIRFSAVTAFAGFGMSYLKEKQGTPEE